MSATDLLWVVYTFLPGAFVLDLMIFSIALWWGTKKVRKR